MKDPLLFYFMKKLLEGDVLSKLIFKKRECKELLMLKKFANLIKKKEF